VHDTAEFDVATIGRCWDMVGSGSYPKSTRLLVTAHAGRSNGYRSRLSKPALAKLVQRTALEITVCHFPPGTQSGSHRAEALEPQVCDCTRRWTYEPTTVLFLHGSLESGEGDCVVVACLASRRLPMTPSTAHGGDEPAEHFAPLSIPIEALVALGERRHRQLAIGARAHELKGGISPSNDVGIEGAEDHVKITLKRRPPGDRKGE